MPKVGDRKALVIRDNRLVRSSYWLTPAEKRFVYWLFWSYGQNGSREQVVSITELAKFCEIDGGSVYRTMYEVAHRLQGRVVVIWDVVENAPSFVNFTEKITPDLGKGTIKVVVHSAIEPLLKDLHKDFTITALETAVRLSSFYAMRLYDLALCHRYRNDGMLYSVEELKAELGVLELGRKNKSEVEIREDRYPVWNKFKQKVLDRAVAEVNEKTDVEVMLTVVKTGKNVTHVRMTSRENRNGEAVAGLTEKQGDMASSLIKVGMPPAEARKVVDAYGANDPERISWHLAQSKDKKMPLAWLRAGLKKDYRPQLRMSFEEKQAERAERDREAKLRRRPPTPGASGEPQSVGALLSATMEPTLKAALEKMAAGVKKKVVDV